jgi:hypothetical protein
MRLLLMQRRRLAMETTPVNQKHISTGRSSITKNAWQIELTGSKPGMGYICPISYAARCIG